MRILVENHGEGPDIRLWVPLGLFCNRLTAAVAARFLARYGTPFTAAQLWLLFHELRGAKRNLGCIPLVEVDSADGSRVRILL